MIVISYVLCYRSIHGNDITIKGYELEQLLLLPPDIRQWLPEDDLVFFIVDYSKPNGPYEDFIELR